MVRIFRHYVSPLKLTLAAVDFALIFAAIILAEYCRYALLGDYGGYSTSYVGWIAKLLVPSTLTAIMVGVGGYHADANADMRIFAIRLFITLAFGGIILSAFAFLFPVLPLWRSILLLCMLFSWWFVWLFHWLMVLFADNQLFHRRVVVLGAGKRACKLKQFIESSPDAGLNIVSIVALKGEQAEIEYSTMLEDIASFEEYAMAQKAELIIVANDTSLSLLPLSALISCKLSGVQVQDILSFYEQVRGYVELDTVQSEWIIFSEGFRGGNGAERITKRLLDVIVSLLFLGLTLPIMILTAVAIKLTSAGPVFYRQERVGYRGRVFRLLKFRSMCNNAEEEGTPQWAQEKDPRVTAVGRFIRTVRIDELPQIFNVLKGDMSFVGPRPERPYFVEQLKQEIPFYQERHYLKPGITGWAQIRFPYGASVSDAKKKLEYDLYYVKNYSLFLDVLIILQTLRVVLFPLGVR